MDKSKEKESRQQKNIEKMKSENKEATRKNQEKSKGADANANDNVWFATIFLCSLEIERQLHWWRYSALNKGFEIPICWFLLLLTSLANLSALLPSTDDFPREYYTDLRQFFFALVALLNSLAAIGLWIELHWLLAPILIVYLLFWTVAFAYLLCLMPFLVYSDETLPIFNLLANLLPLNVLAGKSLFEAFFLLRSKRQWQAKGKERRKLGLKDNSNKRKVWQGKTGVPEKMWFDQLGQNHGAAVAENSTIARTIELVDDWIGRNGCKKEKNIHSKDEEDNLSHFYGQIAEREICIGSRKLNGMEGGPESVVIKSKNGEKIAAEGQIVHLANGEVRRRRRMLKKKRKRGMPMMANPKTLMFPAIVEKESSASTTSTTAAEGQWDEEEIQHHQYSNNNRGRNMANQGREPLTTMNVPLLMGRGENKKKKPPIPRPRCFRQNFGPASAVGLYPMGSPLSPPSSNSTFLASSSPMPMPLTISRMNSPNRGYQETEV